MSGRSSRTKGQKGEREVAAIFTAHGLPAERSARQGGVVVHGDLSLGSDDLSVEVKRCEHFNVPAWLEQAHEQAPEGSTPVLAFRRSQRSKHDDHPAARWHVAVPLEDFLRLYVAATSGAREYARMCAARDGAMRELRAEGKSHFEIAQHFGMDLSEVRRALDPKAKEASERWAS